MSLQSGVRLGVYEIVAPLGAGGMGEVYRARDTKLNRDVAVKILPDSFASDPERLVRFRREAQVLASLNHPNIAAIYGFEDSSDVHALVLELVDGLTLADIIAGSGLPASGSGPAGRLEVQSQKPKALPLNDALDVARQLAEALEAAHEQGIIHRDLKPANIKVREDGTVKVLDFGLAKALDPTPGSGLQAPGDLTASPTLTSPLGTMTGVILGTAAYMAPEQARGKSVDKRADIWAFGCVLFEMLTGTRPFDGEDLAESLGAVIHKEPEWSRLPAGTPASIRMVLRRCLQKDPKQRLRDVGDLRLALQGAFDSEPATPQHTQPTSRVMRVLPWVGTAAASIAAVTMLALWAPWKGTPASTPMRLEVGLGADVSLDTAGGSAAFLSPDGATLAFVGLKSDNTTRQLYVRRLEQLQATPLPGTEGARDAFFSPDGKWIAFFAGGKLRKVSVTGGAAVTLCDAPDERGGTWTDEGAIVFSMNQAGLSVVSAGGGVPQPLTTLAPGEATERFPQMLPGGRAVLFTSHTATLGFNDATIVVQQVPNGTRKAVVRGGYYGRYLPSGHLVYIRDGTLFAVPFDLDRLEATGQPVPVLESVSSSPNGGISARAQFAASTTGTLVYLPAQVADDKRPIEWLTRDGKTAPLRSTPANWRNLAIAPDGRRLAIEISDGGKSDIWVYEWARDALTRLTFGSGTSSNPVWTPDGERVVFRTRDMDNPVANLYWRKADGTGPVQRLTESKYLQFPASWDPSGKFLAFYQQNPQSYDLMILPLQGDEASGWKAGTPSVVLDSPSHEVMPIFSPDGRWLAYRSTESGRNEIYVRPFPGPGGTWQISSDGGYSPRWSRTRHELFYSTTDGRIMVASYSADGRSFRAEKPRPWTERRIASATPGIAGSGDFDLHPDGDRFAVVTVQETPPAEKLDQVVFVSNFFDELRRLAPVK